MKLILVLTSLLLIFSCSKKSECICNDGNGEYEYFSSYGTSDGTNGNFGDLEEECNLQDRLLKDNGHTGSYCEMR